MKKRGYFMCTLLLISISVWTQEKVATYRVRTIAFYNLENLFDTIDDVNKYDELSPIMRTKENKSKVYWDKINKLSSVIAQIGKPLSKTSPALIGVSEIENRKVLEDLIDSKILKEKGYEIIHYDSPDQRGIDVALLYQQKYFKPVYHESINPNIYQKNRKVSTRDQLWVSGYLDDELIHIIVNHWPSRRGGVFLTRPLREKAAYQVKSIVARIRQTEDNPKIVILGDFNDDPVNTSFKEVLKTKSSRKMLKEGDLFNPFERMFKRGMNSLVFGDGLNLFDQILVSSSLVKTRNTAYRSYKMYKAAIFNKRFLTISDGRFKGYPFRSFSNDTYTGGYSDHYPVYIYLIKQEF